MATSQSPVATVKIVGRTIGTDLARCILNAGNTSIANFFRNLATFFQAIALGAKGFNGYVSTGGVQATDAVTFSSFANNNTVTVNGVVFTGKTAGTQSGVQQFSIGTSDTAAATNLAARINNTDGVGAPPAKVFGVVTASSAATVVTITAVEPGAVGNLYTLAISANGSVTGANFASGTDGTVTAISKGL
jgi:hypothetical protein